MSDDQFKQLMDTLENITFMVFICFLLSTCS